MARLEELERKFEENPRRYFAPLANEYRKAGDARRAAELCHSQLPEVPGHISGHIVLGQALYDARDFDGSRAALETALALDPENIVALRYLGDIARETGDAAEAERWYSRTLEADPYNEAATTALQALRSAPRVAASPSGDTQQTGEEIALPTDEYQRRTDETPRLADEAPSEGVAAVSLEPQPATDSLAAGFEPTSHVEAEHSEPLEPRAAVEVTPVEVAHSAPTESAPATVRDSRPEPMGTDLESQAVSPAGTTAGAPGVAGEAAPVSDSADATEAPTGAELAVEPAGEPRTEAPTESELTVESVTEPPEELTAAEVESPPTEVLRVTGEFAGDLAVSTAPEESDAAPDEPPSPEPAEERFDVAAHAPPEPETLEEAIQAEERVLESAAPFVTETMADLYMEQGYPHEALELLLQLSEQRPHDEELRAKIEHIESVIVARRDAAVAAARAERAEMAEAAVSIQAPEDASEAAEPVALPEAPFDAAVAEVDSSAFAVSQPALDEPISVRELFARMDRARPRGANTVTPRPISRRRSDFVPMPEAEAAENDASDDPFAFPSPPAPSPVPRTSGPQQTFNPSTADSDDFDAWLRGLRGP